MHLILGDGIIGGALTALPNIAGVAFTGSTEVAKIINRKMAANDGAIGVLIAETGGLNAMFVDTSALKEQIVDDVIISAFGSAGQRCSALRVLYLPHETADEIIDCLKGAMDELIVANPKYINTDIGPVIDNDALQILKNHCEANKDKIIKQLSVDNIDKNATYFPPTIIELKSINECEREIFGPILHIIRYNQHEIEIIANQLKQKNYGLTMGCHSRLDSFVEKVRKANPVGNYYVKPNNDWCNCWYATTAAGMDFSHVVKCSIFLKDMGQFPVVNEAYGKKSASNPPARETVEVSRLPKDVNVEISCIAVK